MKVPLHVKRRLITIHRWVSLILVAFWLAQVGTGFAIVFHWELDDALIPVSASSAPVDTAALSAAIETLPPGWSFASLWASGGTLGRFDLHIENTAQNLEETLRITGNGTVLRRLSGDSWIDQVVTFHQNLLAGDIGSTIIGLSGIMLASNIIMGFVLAWPGFKNLRRAVFPKTGATAPARTYGRHRAVGLVIAIPAAILITCGVLMVFEDAVENVVHAQPPPLSAPPASETVPPARILDVAMARFPTAALTALLPPDQETPYYVVRVRQPGEWRRAFGKTTLEISTSGDILRIYEPGQGPWARTVIDNLYPVHTGEAGGVIGRLLVMVVGAGLLTVIYFGLRLWWQRR